MYSIVGIQTGYSHYVPDDAGTIRAGSDTLFVITLDFDTSDSGFVLRHGLQQPVAMWLQLPNTNLQQLNPNSFKLTGDYLQITKESNN